MRAVKIKVAPLSGKDECNYCMERIEERLAELEDEINMLRRYKTLIFRYCKKVVEEG